MELLAHSENTEKNTKAQTYKEHIKNVADLSTTFAKNLSCFKSIQNDDFLNKVKLSAELHDIGKLDETNQKVLNGQIKSSNGHLPINHVYAGTKICLDDLKNFISGIVIAAHHIGLTNLDFNDKNLENYREKDQKERKLIENDCENLIQKHLNCELTISKFTEKKPLCEMEIRFLLSCLVDGDWTDTSNHYGVNNISQVYDLKPQERLNKLKEFISNKNPILDSNEKIERNKLRNSMFQSCLNFDPNHKMFSLSGFVGYGKTTSSLALALTIAKEKKLRRIFTILPLTSIIDQTVNVFNQSVLLEDENPRFLIAQNHHKVEFSTKALKRYSSSWNAPIVVTTSVQFFESLASNMPNSLRKLHNIAGSVIIIDEAHASIPNNLWSLTLKWLEILTEHYGCYVIFSSGSMIHFWENKFIKNISRTCKRFGNNKILNPFKIKEVVSLYDYNKMKTEEQKRIKYIRKYNSMNRKELVDWVLKFEGSKLLILNTIQSAAIIAKEIANKNGRNYVEHLSTSICPKDRNKTINNIKTRLKNKEDFILVATSCVQSGMDFSFDVGFREFSDHSDLIQSGGRVNREFENPNGGEIYSFDIFEKKIEEEDILLTKNFSLDDKIKVLKELYKKNKVGAEHSSLALDLELEIWKEELFKLSEDLVRFEKEYKFENISDNYKIIDENTIPVLIDNNLFERIIKNDLTVSSNDIMMNSVSIRKDKAVKNGVINFKNDERKTEIGFWTKKYDDFLGYMVDLV